MKKLAFLAAALFSVGSASAKDLHFYIGDLEEDIILIYDENAYCLTYCPRHFKWEYIKIDKNTYWQDDEGYYHIKLPEAAGHSGESFIIDGDYICEALPLRDYSDPKNMYIPDGAYYHKVTKFYQKKDFKRVQSSPFLVEYIKGKKVLYEPWNLFMKVAPSFEKVTRTMWLDCTPPWAEGEPGPGIGAFIEVEFQNPVWAISVLNGYVDFFKTYLYQQNNRVKTMTVLDMENKRTYTMHFEDYVYFNALHFDKETKHIKLIIDSVYPGTKYDDTCISAIVPERHDWTPQITSEEELLKKYKEKEKEVLQ
ncbi:MAG: hypothetical protein LBR16_07745 [Treponema sp.]|jgi:hypothetical protein|nr:hypothetical protein [Treponema sp.]